MFYLATQGHQQEGRWIEFHGEFRCWHRQSQYEMRLIGGSKYFWLASTGTFQAYVTIEKGDKTHKKWSFFLNRHLVVKYDIHRSHQTSYVAYQLNQGKKFSSLRKSKERWSLVQFRQWLVAWSSPSHYLNQCWNDIWPKSSRHRIHQMSLKVTTSYQYNRWWFEK